MARPYPPAWYPDPRHPTQLRRWNGRAWTNEVRPFPAWLQALELSPGPARGNRMQLVRRLWAASTLSLTMAVLLLLSLNASSRSAVPEERVSDKEFLAAADVACAKANRDVFEPYRSSPDSDPEALATAVEAFVAELRTIDVAGADRAKVGRWIDAWATWTQVGHAYAKALADGDKKLAASISAKGLIPRTEINRFAYANGLTECVL